MINIRVTKRFVLHFKSLDKSEKETVIQELEVFRENPLDRDLKTHPLTGKLLGLYSFSVLPDLRILFRFLKKDKSEVLFYDIGTHEIYK